MLSHFLRQKKLLGFLFLLIFAGIAISTLWPFDFYSANGVNWISGRSGLHFSAPGVLLSVSPLLVPASAEKNPASIELWLRSDEIWSRRTILSFYDPTNASQLVIRQWNGGLLISRDSPANSGAAVAEKIYVKNLFQRGQPVFLTITSNPTGTDIFANAVRKQSFSNFQIRASDLSGQLIVGTAPASFSPWRGELYLVSLYDSALTPPEVRLGYDSLSTPSAPSLEAPSLLAQYSFSESSGRITRSSVPSAPDLQMPENFFLPRKGFLQLPSSQYEATWTYFRDLLTNVLGFLPFGFLLCACLANTRLSRFAVLYSFLSGAVFSFFIELLQGYIPQRDSGLTDVITNSLGAVLGALLARRLRRN